VGRRTATGRALTGERETEPAGAPGTGPARRLDDAYGLFGPGSEAWRLDREAFLLLGAGPRALLLQLAHPLVAEGVDQHSDFRRDPWARLEGTLRSYLRIIYGGRPAALDEIARLGRLHERVTGPVADPEAAARFGPRYEARDPALSLWVHATLVDSTMAAYSGWLAPLDRRAAERFYAETVPLGAALGIPGALLPADLDAFEAYMGSMLDASGPVHPTSTARSLAQHILHPTLAPLLPALGAVPAPLYDWILWPSIGLLPAAVRDEYGLAWGGPRRLVASWQLAMWRAWRPLIPTALRWMPQARAADRRVARALDTAALG
jgi:uncharacterized protein (DUF2236 family)